MSPDVLTPAGVAESGLQIARIFWAASGHASWFLAPISALEDLICTIAIVVVFGAAAIIYLLALAEVWALIIAASVLLAFAALPWTWSMFPGWALTVLSASIKVFFLLAVLAIGLNEATGWSTAMAATSGTIADNVSLLMQATVEALLFFGLVYYIPGLMARMVVGGAGPALQAGEAMLADAVGAGAGAAAGAASAGIGAAGNAAAAGAKGAVSGASKVAQMLLR
jgi:type IV secretory pathway TrbL component